MHQLATYSLQDNYQIAITPAEVDEIPREPEWMDIYEAEKLSHLALIATLVLSLQSTLPPFTDLETQTGGEVVVTPIAHSIPKSGKIIAPITYCIRRPSISTTTTPVACRVRAPDAFMQPGYRG